MLIYTVTIGGSTVSVSQLNMVLTFDQTLDYGSFVLRNTQATAYDVGTRVDIDVTDGATTKNYHWIISADEVTKLPRGKYVHAIDIIELTKILEWQTDSIRTFTQPLGTQDRLTLLDVVVRLQATLPIERVDDLFTTRVFAIDNTLRQQLVAIESPEFVFQNKNLKEMLDEVFDFINAIPRLTIQQDTVTLVADFFNERGSLAPSNEFTQVERFNINSYSTALDADIKNLYDTYTTVIEPAPNTYKRLSSESGDFTEDSAYIKTDFPIVFLESLKCKVSFRLPGPQSALVITDPFEIDLTDYILEEEEWQNLQNKPTVANFGTGSYRDNTLYYRRFEPGIYSLFEEVGAMQSVAVIGGKSRIYATLLRAVTDLNLTWLGPNDITFDVTTMEAIDPFFELEFQIEYKAQFDSRTEVKRADTSRIKYESRSYTGQTDNVVRADRVLDRLYKMQQLLGNAEVLTSERHKTLAELKNISDYNADNYVITTIELQFEKSFIMAKYLWSQNFQKVSDFIGLNGDIRLFDIPNDTYKRNVYLENFVEIGTSFVANTSDVKGIGINTFMNTFNNSPSVTYNTPVNLFTFDTTSNPTINVETQTILKPVAKYAGGNSINFYVEFDNPKIAGFQVDIFSSEMEEVTETEETEDTESQNIFQRIVSGIVGFFDGIATFFQNTFRAIYKKPINKGIYYADSTGQVFDFGYYFMTDANVTVAEDLPVINKTARGDLLIGDEEYRVYKDVREEFAMTYTIHVMAAPTLERTIIVGKYLVERNNLLKTVSNIGNQFEVFTDTARYEIHDTRSSKPTAQSAGVSFTITGNKLELFSAIANNLTWGIRKISTNELVFAVNQDGTTIDELYFNFLDKQSNVIYPSETSIVTSVVQRVASLSVLAPSITSSAFTVTWADPNDPSAEEYNVEISNDLTTWDAYTTSNTQYAFSGLNPFTPYTVRVRAVLSGLTSEWIYVVGTTLGVAPPAPTNVSVTLLSERRFEVRWDPQVNIDIFQVQVSESDTFGTIIDQGIKSINGGSVRIIYDYLNSTIDYDTTYYVRVRGTADGQTSAWSSTASITTPEGPITSAPLITNVRIVQETGQLRYKVINTDAQKVILYSDLNDGSSVLDSEVFPNEGVDVQVDPGSATTIFAKAQAVNKEMSAIVEQDFVATEPPGTPLVSPIIIAKGAHRINWFYSINDPLVEIFGIERNPNELNVAEWGAISPALSPDTRGYTDTTNLIAGTTYSYRVLAYNRFGTTASLVEQATAISGVPATPTNLQENNLQGDPGQAFIELTWQRNSTDEDGFIIERSTGGAFTEVGGTPKAQTFYEEVVEGSSGVTYTYRIIAYNEFGNSLPSNTVSVTTT